jgi:hypothetical protein
VLSVPGTPLGNHLPTPLGPPFRVGKRRRKSSRSSTPSRKLSRNSSRRTLSSTLSEVLSRTSETLAAQAQTILRTPDRNRAGDAGIVKPAGRIVNRTGGLRPANQRWRMEIETRSFQMQINLNHIYLNTGPVSACKPAGRPQTRKPAGAGTNATSIMEVVVGWGERLVYAHTPKRYISTHPPAI